MKKINFVKSNNESVTLESMDKEVCKLWNKVYNPDHYANPIFEDDSTSILQQEMNRDYNWYDMLIRPLNILEVGEYDLHCIKVLSIGSWLADNFIICGTNKMVTIDDDMFQETISFIHPILNSYLDLINFWMEENYYIIITED